MVNRIVTGTKDTKKQKLTTLSKSKVRIVIILTV